MHALRDTFASISVIVGVTLLLSACGGGSGGGSESDDPRDVDSGDRFTVNTSVGANGVISPSSLVVDSGDAATFQIQPDNGYNVASVTGCGGRLEGSSYITAPVSADCTITASFIPESIISYQVTARAGMGGMITPSSILVSEGNTSEFVVTTDAGFRIESVSGCGGELNGNIYITEAIISDCVIDATFIAMQPPIVDAGNNQSVDELESVTIMGAASDADGDVVSYAWSQISGTEVSLVAADTLTATFVAPDVNEPQTLVFELVVTDSDGLISSDTVSITVVPIDSVALNVLAATGMPAVGFPSGYMYWSVFEPTIGASGHVAFFGAADVSGNSTAQNTKAVWAGMPGNIEPLFKENDTLPGLPTNVLYAGNSGINSAYPGLTVSTSGFVAHVASLKGAVTTSNSTAILLTAHDVSYTVMRVGDQAHGLPVGYRYGLIDDYAMSDAGVVFTASIVSGANVAIPVSSTKGIWSWSFSGLRLVGLMDSTNQIQGDLLSVKSPQIDDGACTFIRFNTLSFVQINDSGEIAFGADFQSAPGSTCSFLGAILKWKDGKFTPVMIRRAPVPGVPGYVFAGSGFDDFLLLQNGDVTVDSAITNGGSDYRTLYWVRKANGDFEYIAVGGEAVDDGSNFSIYKYLPFGNPPQLGAADNYLVSVVDAIDTGKTIILAGESRDLPYTDFSSVGVSHMRPLVCVGDVPPGYQNTAYFAQIFAIPSSNVERSVASINSNNEVIFYANRRDASQASVNEYGLWRVDSSDVIEKIVETGDMISVSDYDDRLVQFLGVTERPSLGKANRHSNENSVFVPVRLQNTYQALLHITY